jgi:hypothetical protein
LNVATDLAAEMSASDFAFALRSGIYRVMSEQENLNRINVFPVADGDTGTNLCLSLGAALGIVNKPVNEPLGRMLASIADAMQPAMLVAPTAMQGRKISLPGSQPSVQLAWFALVAQAAGTLGAAAFGCAC